MKNEYKCTVCGLIYHSNENKYPFNERCYDCYHKTEFDSLKKEEDYLLNDGYIKEFVRNTVIPFAKAHEDIVNEIEKEKE